MYFFLPDDPLSRDISWQNRYEKNLEWGIRPKLGVLLSPVEKWSFGIAVDHTWVFSAARSFQFSSCSTTTVDIGCEEQINPEVTEASIETKYPWSVRLGSAFFPSNALLLSADVIYHSATAAGSSAISKQATLDLATGMEWYWSPKWALRLGAFTSHANTPEVEKGKVNQQHHVYIYGGALSIARFTQGSSISVGVMPRYGLGASQLFSQLESVTQDTSIFAVTTFFTTSYRY
jgi:long-chain fatty acid transport protein